MGIFNCSLCGRACRTRDVSPEVAPDRVIGTAGFCERDYVQRDRGYQPSLGSRRTKRQVREDRAFLPLTGRERAVQQVVLKLPFSAHDRHTILSALGIDHV
jgi:hypothetical protein